MKRPLIIGLTGGMGAGKSLALKCLKEKGVPVLQTDKLGHQLLEEYEFAQSVQMHFGKDVLGRNGKIDRKKLGREVFRDPLKRQKLNEMLHPEILKRVMDWAKKQAGKASIFPLVVEVPLLFESSFERYFDGVLCVSAPSEIRRKRLLKRGLEAAEFKRREKTQWPQTRKNRKSDWVILNQSSRKELKYAVNRWLEQFLKP